MKNILIFAPEFYPASTGFANATKNLIDSILEFGGQEYKIHVYTQGELGNNKEIDGISMIRNHFPKSSLYLKKTWWFIKTCRMLARYIDSNNIDVILFETNTFPIIQNYILKRYPNKCAVRIHSTTDTEMTVFGKPKSFVGKLYREKKYSFMRNIRYITSTSAYYIDFVKHYYLEDNPFMIWDDKYYGILHNTNGGVIGPAEPVFSNNYLTLGKMAKSGITQKGITDLVMSINELNKKQTLPNDFKLTIIGQGTHEYIIKGMIDKFNLSSYINIIPQASHEEVFNFIKNSKAIILLSRFEGQSMFITETISIGKPLIVTDSNGMQGMILDGENGLKVRTGDVYDSACKIEKFLKLDNETITKMSKRSFDIYERNFTPKAVYSQFDDLVKVMDLNL